jgi:tRNA dimethylallyltransferase
LCGCHFTSWKNTLTAAERPLLVLCGSTASGKTSLSLKLARMLPLRLISADSIQVYRGMDIGTAKPKNPDKELFALLDLVDPGQGFSAGRFASLAGQAAEMAWKVGQIPCVVGGTGLYIHALLHGLADIPSVPEKIREEVRMSSPQALGEELVSQDPESAAKTDMKNPRRVQRAVEVLRSTGRGLAAWQAAGTHGALPHGKRLMLGLNPSNEALLHSVRQRNEEALSLGWLEEAKTLAGRFSEAAIRSTGAIGYGELLDVAAGKSSMQEAKSLIETRTLQYARRQRTWFKKDKEIEWHVSPDAERIAQRIKDEL